MGDEHEERENCEWKTERSWHVWLVGNRGQCPYGTFRATAQPAMELEAMSQPLKEAELSQIAKHQVIPECIPECPFSAGLFQ